MGIARLELDAPLIVGGHTLSLTPLGPGTEASTQLGGDAAERCTLQLESYAQGGLSSVSGRGPKRSAYLPARRFALIQALLSPEPPAQPASGRWSLARGRPRRMPCAATHRWPPPRR